MSARSALRARLLPHFFFTALCQPEPIIDRILQAPFIRRALSGLVKEFLKPGGTFITSGIIEGRQDEVRAAIEGAGFTILAHRAEDDWHCFVAE